MKHRRNLFLALPGVPLCVLALMLSYSIGGTFWRACAVQGWTATPAQLLEGGFKKTSVLRGGTVFKPFATYTYVFEGRRYEGSRVSITDGEDAVGDTQQRLGQQLAEAFSRGETITVYVDPNQPESAVYDRMLRWELLAYRTAGALVFGVLGVAFLWPVLRSVGKQPAD